MMTGFRDMMVPETGLFGLRTEPKIYFPELKIETYSELKFAVVA